MRLSKLTKLGHPSKKRKNNIKKLKEKYTKKEEWTSFLKIQDKQARQQATQLKRMVYKDIVKGVLRGWQSIDGFWIKQIN